ncbi:hypothetical protein PR048_015914 [Dryococelus australis]|uniref:HTH psq-type domain-containing protein n=1 Tax=Dryococelus australis TaxID=614101 RepID=A0ABQ9HIA0_9NEOP|nr:hypothetical protein PR048_015914 [Dryococelus australis]
MDHMNAPSSSKMGIKRKSILILEKLNIINMVNNDRVKIAEQLNIPILTLNTIMSNREKILLLSMAEQPGRKKLKLKKFQDVNVIMDGFHKKRALNLTVDGPILRQNA